MFKDPSTQTCGKKHAFHVLNLKGFQADWPMAILKHRQAFEDFLPLPSNAQAFYVFGCRSCCCFEFAQ